MFQTSQANISQSQDSEIASKVSLEWEVAQNDQGKIELATRFLVRIDLTKDELDFLNKIRTKEISEQREQILRDAEFRDQMKSILDSFLVSGHSYRVIEFLGGGAEGYVYRCVGPDGTEVSLKDSEPERFRNVNVNELEKAINQASFLGIPTIADPSLMKRDDKAKRLISKYIHGVELGFMNCRESLLESYGFPDGLLDKIRAGLEKWQEAIKVKKRLVESLPYHKNPSLRRLMIILADTATRLQRNLVLEFSTGLLYLIDAK